MTTEITITNPETIQPATKPKTAKPKTAKTEKPVYTSITGGAEYPAYKNTIPDTLKSLFPELYDTAKFLHGIGYGAGRGIKFFFSFSPDSNKPNKRVTNQFYLTFTGAYKKPATINPAYLNGFNGKFRHQLTGNKFFTLFPLIKSLFSRLQKHGAGNFILNISYASTSSPAKRREHIITFNASDTDLT